MGEVTHDRGMPRHVRGVLLALAAICCLGLFSAKPHEARADIPFPYQFMPTIDNYAAYDGANSCENSPKPGTVGLRNYLSFWNRNPDGSARRAEISRDCSRPGNSEHKEGRALDFYVDARFEPGKGLELLNGLLRADEHGNPHAFARRFGIMYIQWNSRIFRMYGPNRGKWLFDTNNGCDGSGDDVVECHINHMHFSLSWAGARKQTSWWTTTQPTRTGCGSTLQTWRFNSGFGPLVQIKRIRDAYGQVFDTQSEIRNSYWRVQAGGRSYFANQPLSLLASPRPQARIPIYSGGWCALNL